MPRYTRTIHSRQSLDRDKMYTNIVL